MNRRDLLLTSSVLAATSALTVGSELVDKGKEQLGDKFNNLEERFDELEHHHKNLIRVGGLAFALSTGIDVVSFL